MNRLAKALPVVAFLAGGSAGIYVFTTTQNDEKAAFHDVASVIDEPRENADVGIPRYEVPPSDARRAEMVRDEVEPRIAPAPADAVGLSPPRIGNSGGTNAASPRVSNAVTAAPPRMSNAVTAAPPRMANAAPPRMANSGGTNAASPRVSNAVTAAPPRMANAGGNSVTATPQVAPDLTPDLTPDMAAPRTPNQAQANSNHAFDESHPDYNVVKVFYATDRAMATASLADAPELLIGNKPLLCVTLACLLLGGAAFLYPQTRRPTAVGALVCLGFAIYFGYPTAKLMLDGYRLARVGPSYGDQRGRFEVGTSEVSVPTSHRVGEIERPIFLRLQVREDETKHIVIRNVERKADDEFYTELRERVETAPDRNVFVFIHGYNVTFDSAVRRTAQIAYDLRFEGAPVCYSWPSQGGLFKYTIDETNVMWTVPHLKRFLLGVVDHSGATSVNLVAHSMGNRALTEALRQLALELREESHLFNEVVLAAPDVDAEIFRRDLAPAIIRTANRVSLYASSGDQALIASKQVHGYPRAGDSGDGLVLVRGVDTIDVSTIDTSLLGHSYYGDNYSILEDLADVIHNSIPASQRRWLSLTRRDGLDYWIFRHAAQAAQPDGQRFR